MTWICPFCKGSYRDHAHECPWHNGMSEPMDQELDESIDPLDPEIDWDYITDDLVRAYVEPGYIVNDGNIEVAYPNAKSRHEAVNKYISNSNYYKTGRIHVQTWRAAWGTTEDGEVAHGTYRLKQHKCDK